MRKPVLGPAVIRVVKWLRSEFALEILYVIAICFLAVLFGEWSHDILVNRFSVQDSTWLSVWGNIGVGAVGFVMANLAKKLWNWSRRRG